MLGMSDVEAPPTDGELSLELVQRIQGGDRAAWERLYARYHDRVLFAIRCRLGPRLRGVLQSEDVLQSIMADALTDLRTFAPRGTGALGRWLHACVHNKLRAKAEYHGADVRARQELTPPSALDARVAADGDALEYFDGERFGRLERAMADLAGEQREVVILRAVEGQSNQEAADALGIAPEAASKLYNRALARLAVRVDPAALG
jgi:RNA polymerase sigma-70 factor (ECF subfamily)